MPQEKCHSGITGGVVLRRAAGLSPLATARLGTLLPVCSDSLPLISPLAGARSVSPQPFALLPVCASGAPSRIRRAKNSANGVSRSLAL